MLTAALAASGCAASPPAAKDAISVRSAAAPSVTTVIAVSIDGLNPSAIRKLGARGAPTLHRLIKRGASTLNARTERELTDTLPNHTGMVTSRRITAAKGGHGVTWNDDRKQPATVQEAAGHRVASVFSVIHRADLKTAMFASKTKFSLFERSWDRAIDRSTIRPANARLVRLLRHDIANKTRGFRFVHLSAPDVAGHAHGFMSPAYLDAVRATDRLLGKVVKSIQADDTLAGNTVLVVTADHGGKGANHRDPTKLANYRIPFIVWGPGVDHGADLYDLNPDYADPGRKRTTYASGRQPVRNGDVANLVTDLLGLDPLAGSQLDSEQDLDVG
jgi:predicted AlkP superfamily pyrophosphatase or phosphodiesterase